MRLASETISCPTEGEEMTGQDPKKNDLDTRAFRDDAGGQGRLCYVPGPRMASPDNKAPPP